MRIAFYAPLKPPDHPVPSGDREMARLLMRGLREAGHECELVSRLRTYSPSPDTAILAGFRTMAATEGAELLARWRDGGRPDVWLTYHTYYKAPDLLGPPITGALNLPYVTAEASHAAKRDRDGWADWQRPVIDALRQGAVHFCLTPIDREGLSRLLGGDDRLVDLPPFLDAGPFEAIQARTAGGRLELVTVAMMRPGKKVRSYRFLARALGYLADIDWRLTIVGDGEARDDVRAAFTPLPESRITWRGELDRRRLPAELACADLFVWPGFEEDYGMVYLEAEAAGLPVVALASDGVRQAVRHGETGLLLDGESPAAFAETLRSLAGDARRREAMAGAARIFARRERSLAAAAVTLDRGLRAAMRRHRHAAHFRHESPTT